MSVQPAQESPTSHKVKEQNGRTFSNEFWQFGLILLTQLKFDLVDDIVLELSVIDYKANWSEKINFSENH